MTIEPDDPRLVYLAEADATAAGGTCMVYRDRWFSVHPERGLIFWQPNRRKTLKGASPQCNTTEAIARDLAARMYPWAETRFYPVVIQPIDARDYA